MALPTFFLSPGTHTRTHASEDLEEASQTLNPNPIPDCMGKFSEGSRPPGKILRRVPTAWENSQKDPDRLRKFSEGPRPPGKNLRRMPAAWENYQKDPDRL